MNMEIDRIKKFPIEDGKITAVEWIKDVKVPEPNLLGICSQSGGILQGYDEAYTCAAV